MILFSCNVIWLNKWICHTVDTVYPTSCVVLGIFDMALNTFENGNPVALRSGGLQKKMAGVSDCFGIGSIVSCKTCYNKEIEGEVLAFDPQTKMLILSILLKLYSSFITLRFISNIDWVVEVGLKTLSLRKSHDLILLD